METSQSRKSFERIHEDYAFFLEHSTEPVACRAAMLAEIRRKFSQAHSVGMLDFGCGGGEFLAGLLGEWSHPKDRLSLELAEVDAGYLERARQMVEGFSNVPIKTSSIAEGPLGSLDLITSNHVLYYVREMEATLKLLLKRLKPAGRGILILGGRQNQLCFLWELVFGSVGQKLPYFLAEDVLAVLKEMKVKLVLGDVHSTLRFPDTAANRLKILRFLFEGKMEGVRPEALSDYMDRWSAKGKIVMENVDRVFLIGPGIPSDQ